MRISRLFFVVAMCVACSCPNTTKNISQTDVVLANLKSMVDSGKTMFGQANATTITYLNGVSHSDTDRGDCKDITGDNPAFHESDFMWYRDAQFMLKDIKALRDAKERGALVGYCWHIGGMNTNEFYAYNRKTGELAGDSALVKAILSSPDRTNNIALDWLLTKLDSLVIPVMKELAFPITFRPWHEMNGEWFWWGRDCCSPEEYKALYQLTVDYIREAGADNVIFVWSPDKAFPMDYYPGDEYVDILGMDIYEPGIEEYSAYEKIIPALSNMIKYADTHGKVAALTECGCRKRDDGSWRYPDDYPHFWTDNILEKILNNPSTDRLAWVMSWYGADWSKNRSNDAYIPYIGWERPNADIATEDFKKFIASDRIITEKELRNLYK